MLFGLVVLAQTYQYQLAKALVSVRKQLGYPSAYAACVAQTHLTYDQLRNRESGRAALSIEDLVGLAHGWGRSPAELFCLLSEALDDNTYLPIAEKAGTTVDEAKRRFQAKQVQTGMQFEQLFLLVLRDQIKL